MNWKLGVFTGTALVLAAILTACGSPSVVRVNSAEIHNSAVQKVYVPRFEGNPNFVEESTDLFVSELESHVSSKIIQGQALRSESPDILAGGNMAPADEAIAKAKQFGADLVIMGKVSTSSGAGMFNGYSTVRVIKVSTGEIVASFHRPSGMLVGNSVHQAVMAAVGRTARDVAAALK